MGYIWENGLDHYPFQEPDGWLIPYEEHDLVVTNITAPGSVYVNSTTSIYSTIYNVRLNNESNITVNFLVDGVNQGNTTISYIGSKASKDVSFEWAAPCYVGNHTLTIYAEPVVNESIVWNNLLDKNISVIKKEIIYVDDDFEDDPENHTWNTIQEGIADAKNGDIVFVYNGTYYENVVVDKTINLAGEDEDTTIIDGGGNGDVIKVAADQVNINGFSIKNSEERNAGVDISSHNNITVAYCNIFNNRIGINLYGCSDITISDCGITNNDYVGISGWVCASNNIQISNSSISDNSAEGIHIWGASISITNCTIADNEGEKSGPCAGVYLETSYDSQITNCTISNNTWAGIYISGYDASNNCIIHCDIHSNSGPGIRFWSGGTNSTIADCCIYSNDNHGIELRSFNTITNCIISNNYGCGIYTEVGANQILGCNIHSNYENGIHFEATGVSHNQVANCKCSDNKNGIYIGNIWGSQNYEITGCKILNNDCGINILRSGSKIINCDIVNNNEGIVGEESDNIIYRNNIINNEQAVDTGNNLWDNGSVEGGNYWSDHKCTGNPSNGSQPYHIDADNIDNFPFEDANGWLPEKQPPVASFLHSPQYPENPVVNQTIIFDASSSYDIGGTIVSYEWNFGDGTTGTGEIVNHLYSDAEDYLVTLTVTDDDAAIDTDMTVITIWPIPKLIYVDNDFEDNPISHKWNTIQEGIDDANSGDTVFVYSGTYYENVVIDKNVINLVGENKVNTIIDGSIRDGIWINADWISISKFRINSSTYSGITISSANNRITNCILSNNDKGISLGGDNNCVENCTVSNSNEHGISLYYDSQNNIVTNCTISSNGQSKSYPGHGIYFEGSTYNKIISCNISENKDDGIRLVGSSDNKITNCDIYSNNKNGVSLVGGYHGSSSNNNVSYCSIYLNDQIGIQIRGSPNNLFRNNALWDNIYNLNVDGSDQDIDLSNTINEKPIFYLVEESNLIINGVTDDVGYLGLVSCNNITAKNLKLSHNYHGLLLAGTTNTTIENCDISNNNDGIYLCRYSSHNNISNSITSDNTCGIHFYGNGPSNTVTNCDILNNSKEGIYFDLNSGGGEVTNCTISNNGQGIHIDSWTINKIASCSISKNRIGIYAGNSFYQQIMNCIISNNDEDGVYLSATQHYALINNIILDNGNRGIFCAGSPNIITNCIIWDNSDDLDGVGGTATYSDIKDGDPGEGNICADPMFVDAGGDYHLQAGSPCTDTGTCEGAPLDDFEGEFRPWDGDGDGVAAVDMGADEYVPAGLLPPPSEVWVDDDYPLGACNDGHTWGYDAFAKIQEGIDAVAENGTVYVFNGTYYENVVVAKSLLLIGEDRNATIIDGGGSGDVVRIVADNCTIDGFMAIGSELYCGGIKIESDNNLIKNNIVSNNFRGISLDNSSNNTITNNIALSNVDTGISLWDSSNNNKLMNNNVSNTRFGIYVDRSSNNTLMNNDVSNNDCGIELFGWCKNNELMNNEVSNNDRGIYLDYYSSNNKLTNNDVLNNSEGIYLFYSYNNLIYHTNFINNTKQAYGDSGTNFWDNGYPSGGNYWSDYSGSDLYRGQNQDQLGSDEIGDSPYNIRGDAGAQDRYPLMHPWTGDTPLKGDLNHDGIISPADARIALRIAVSGEYVPEADIDGNGCVNALDALRIMQAAAGRIEL